MNSRALVGIAGGGVLAALIRKIVLDGAARARANRWNAVTVNAPMEQVAPAGRRPERLAQLGDAIEFRAKPAPGDKGTELYARPRNGSAASPVERLAGEDPRQQIRQALREAKMLIEVGEVIEPDRQRTTRRTLRNLPLEIAVRRAKGEGVL
jgi:hypothetical protein